MVVCSTVHSAVSQRTRVTGLYAWNSPVTGEFPAQKSNNVENVSIWWLHHDFIKAGPKQVCNLWQRRHRNLVFHYVNVIAIQLLINDQRAKQISRKSIFRRHLQYICINYWRGPVIQLAWHNEFRRFWRFHLMSLNGHASVLLALYRGIQRPLKNVQQRRDLFSVC